jgi:hypothetical protein
MKKSFLPFFLLFLMTVPSLWAAFKIGPSFFEVSLMPGESSSKVIYLENPSDKPVTLVIGLSSFMNSKANIKVACDQWLTFKDREVTVPPKSKKLLPLQIMAPKGMAGEVSAKIGFMEKPSGESMVHIRMPVYVYLISLNGSSIGMDLTSFDAVTNKDKSLGFKIGIKNSGNVHIRPKGSLKVTGTGDRLIKSLPLPEVMPLFEDQEGFLLSDGTVSNLPDGIYSMKLFIALGYDKKYDIDENFSLTISGGKAKIELVK